MAKNKYKVLISNTLIFAVGSFGSKLISFFLVPLYTNVLTRQEYGTVDLITTFANLAVPIFSLVIQDAVLRFGLSGKNKIESVCKNSLVVLIIGSLFSLCMIPITSVQPTLSEWRWYVYVISVINMFSNVIYACARAKEKNKAYAIAGIINSFVLAGMNIFFLLVLRLGVKGYLLANIVAHILSMLFLIFSTGLWKDIRKEKVDFFLLKQMMLFSAPLIINNLSWWALNSLNRIMIQLYCSTDDLGLFTAASKIPNLLSIITSIFSASWTASSIKEYENENDKSFFSNVFKTYSLILFFGQAFILLILKWFMRFYVGEEFYSSWRYVPLLLGGTIFFSFSTFYEAIYQALKKNIMSSITTVIAALVNFATTIVLIDKIGVMAACIAFFVSYFVLYLIRMIGAKKFFKLNVNYISVILSAIIVNIQAILITLGVHEIICSAIAILALLLVNISDLRTCIKVVKDIFKRKL